MKRLLLFLSALMLSISALWAHDVEIDGIYYNLNGTKKTAVVTYKGDYSYDYYDVYSGSVTIPETITYNSQTYSVTSIGPGAFRGCSGLTSVTIPNSVTYIDKYAFRGCSGLTSVIIPNSVTTIGENAFEGCSGLTKVNYLGTVDEWVEIHFRGYLSNPTLYAEDLYINNELLTDVKITSADYIKNFAFDYCQSIKSVEIGNSVMSIGDYAFRGCSGLISVTIPNSVTSIGSSAFSGCSELTSVTIPNSVTSIYNYTFRDCSGLISVTIPNSVTSIGSGAFSGCSELTSVTIPNSVTFIDSDTFDGSSGLTEILVSSNNDEFSSENGVLYNKGKTTLIKYPEAKKDTSFTIPNSVTSIGWDAFRECISLTSVIIPNSVTSIGLDAFYNTGIYNNNSNWDNGVLYIDNCLIEANRDVVKGSYTIKEGTRIIGGDAFSGCSGLTSVTIPNSVTSIGDWAFYDCSGLTKVNYLGNVDKWVEIDFKDSYSNPTSYAKDLYINNELLADIKITTADSIKDYAFYNCQSIKSVVIGDSVISIGGDAFSGCNSLKTVYNCSNLEIIKSNEDHGNVARYADEVINACPVGDFIVNYEDKIIEYIGDENIDEIIIPEYIKGIDEGVFSECSKIRKVISYPTKVPSAYNNSFANYNAYLYVPCDVFEDYDLDYVFGSFKYIKCIAAEEVEGSDKVEIEVDSNNNATIIWPSTGNASSYELVISKNGEVFCTLIFNKNGQLLSIDFSKRSATVGFKFTVTGLEEASKYDYSLLALDENNNELESYYGEFETNGYVEGEDDEEGDDNDPGTAILETLADANITISDGLITYPDTDFTIYNTLGQDVTDINGALTPGVYVVQVVDDFVKVMMK